MGFGQQLAKQYGHFDSARFSPLIPETTRVDNCPQSWLLNNSSLVDENVLDKSNNFVDVGLYDVSYMWYGPISTMTCLLVGIIFSLVRPQNHKQLDSRLISPGVTSLFCWLPKPLRKRIETYYREVGSEDVTEDIQDKSIGLFQKSGAINEN